MNMLKDFAKGAGRAMMKAAEEAQSVEGQVEALLERISEGMLSTDRREGMEQLKGLLQHENAAPVLEAFASMGVPVMCSVLHDDADDLDLVQGALESLLLAMGGPMEDIDEDAEAERQRGGAASAAGALTAHALASDQNALQMLLSLLEVEDGAAGDFYARFWTIQILTRLVSISPFAVQEAIMTRPQGVVKVMDLLREQEVIRNEALLLLITLCRSDEEIQKIVAFEGAFDMLFEIITEEGYVQGGIIVQDSLVLLNNLLRNNPSNQLMFREAGYIANLHRLLFVDPEAPPPAPTGLAGAAQALEDHLHDSAATGGLSVQTVANLLCALEMVSVLTTPPPAPKAQQSAEGASRHEMAVMCYEANYALLAKSGTLDEVVSLALRHGDADVSRPVRVMALHCAAQLAHGRQLAQDRLSSSNVTLNGRAVPVLQALLHRLLTTDDAAEEDACTQLLSAFCHGNPDGQMAVVSTMLPISGATSLDASSAFGELLVRAILGGKENAKASARAAVVMCHLLRGNTAAKEKALQVPLSLPASGKRPAFLVPSTVAQLSAAVSHAATSTALCLLQMLIVLTHECPSAVTQLLEEPAHLPLLVDVVQGRTGGGDSILCGLSATLMGCCLLYNEGGREPGRIGKLAILDVITSRLGLSDFFAKLEGLRESELMEAAAQKSDMPTAMTRAAVGRLAATGDSAALAGSAQHAPENPFDAEFARFLDDFVPVLKQQALALFSQPHSRSADDAAGGRDAAPGGNEDPSVITQLRHEIEELQLRNAALAQDLMLQKSKGGAPLSTGDPEAAAKAELRCSRLQLENDALKQEVERLTVMKQRQDAEVSATRAEAAESLSLLHKMEAELAALSEAYTQLEQDAFNKEAEMRQLQQRLNSEGPNSSRQDTTGKDEEDGLQDELDDLLVCLGQEEQKVAILSEKLTELGVDAEALIAHVCVDEDDDDDSQGGNPGGVDVHQWVASAMPPPVELT